MEGERYLPSPLRKHAESEETNGQTGLPTLKYMRIVAPWGRGRGCQMWFRCRFMTMHCESSRSDSGG